MGVTTYQGRDEYGRFLPLFHRCDSCASLSINGVPCHETGCPESHIDLRTGKPYLKECFECGGNFEAESKFDRYCEDCASNIREDLGGTFQF